MISLSNTAVLILTCNDFEALDVTVNQVLRTTPPEVPIYLLSNCAGLPGADICEDMCRFTSRAQYGRVHWINPGTRQHAYHGIANAIESDVREKYIVKLDDDVFPLTSGWLESLIACYAAQDPERIAYVSGMVNNNPFGFSQLIDLPELRPAYDAMMSGQHLSGTDIHGYQNFRVLSEGEVDPGGWGTVWQFPHLARWIHEETTLQPDRYAALVKDLTPADFDTSARYSINVMLFERDMWAEVDNGGQDDEEMFHLYCHENEKEIVIERSIPFVHLYFGPQKRYMTDLMEAVRAAYPPDQTVQGKRLVEDWTEFKNNWQLELLKRSAH